MSIRRRWFGPSRQEIWQELSSRMQATYTPATFWKGDRVDASHREWTVTLDTEFNGGTKSLDTRLRAPYLNPEGFRFTIYRRGIWSDIAKRLGMQDVEVGDTDFDRDFIVKSTHESRVRTLLWNARIRELIEAQPRVYFTVDDDEGWFRTAYPEGVDALRFLVPGTVKDLAQLKLLFDLFAATLDELCRMGSAYEDDPGVEL